MVLDNQGDQMVQEDQKVQVGLKDLVDQVALVDR